MRLFYPLNKEITLISLLTVAGIGLRLQQYWANRSLWLDEALLSLNIINRSFEQLLAPLDNDQGAPIGFLWTVKLIINQIGATETALRLFPLISSIIVCLIFYPLARQYLTVAATRWAYLLLLTCSPLIYYASEVKQYSSDVLFALIAFSLFFWLQKPQWSYLVLVGLVGMTLSWFSHPVIFILASQGILAFIFGWQQKKYHHVALLLLIGILWLVSFGVNYLVSLQYLTQNQLLVTYWQNDFAPSAAQPMSWTLWVIDSWVRLFRNTLEFPFPGLAILVYALGLITLYQQHQWPSLVISLPVFLVFLAAVLHVYPFGGRLLLFTVPFLVIGLGAGLDRLYTLLHEAHLTLIGWLLLGLFFYQPVLGAYNLIETPQLREEIRPVLDYVDSKWQNEDVIYIYYASAKPFAYYAPRYRFKPQDYVIGAAGRQDWSKYIDDINTMRHHRRVWFLFSHVYQSSGANEELLFLSYLNNTGGVLKDKVQQAGASAYLYEFP